MVVMSEWLRCLSLHYIVEAAVQGLVVTAYNNSEATVTWMLPEYFELKDFVIKYFFKPEHEEMIIVDRPPYQISDLISGQTYTVRVTSRYLNAADNIVVEADTTEDTVTLEKISMYILAQPALVCLHDVIVFYLK